MKKIFLSISLLFSSLLYAQDFDKLMVNKQIECADISYNSGLYFVQYLEEGNLDSARQLLTYWEGKCGEREPIYRAKILLALKDGSFNDAMLTSNVMDYMYNYMSRIEMMKYANDYAYELYQSYYGYTPPGQEFDIKTQTIANSLKNKFTADSTAYLIAEFYSGEVDTTFLKLQSSANKESLLVKEYNKEVDKYLKQGEFHMAAVAGIWIPTGDLKTLGVHPDLGFQMGAKVGKMNYDLSMIFKFLNSANEYTAYRGDTPEQTDTFFGGYIGADVGRDIYAKNGHEIQLTGGVAFDGFDALEEDEAQGLDSKTVWSYNLNFGLSYRYYLTNSFYLGVRAKYNIVDYSLNGVTDFTDNTFTIQLTIGVLNNEVRNSNLRALGYRLRK